MYEIITAILISRFHVPANEVHPQATLEELGLDSLDLVDLGLVLEEHGVRVSDDDLSTAGDLAGVAELLTLRRTAA